MRFLSVCSGIEAASVAWEPLGWKAVGFSEIEPFPCAVLAHRFPNTPNYGSLTEYASWPIEPGTIDLLVGGTPCQSFSVAGLRKGMADPRGNLALVFLGLADRVKPRWIVWENVPGVLSSNGGRDFGSFLGALEQLGYGWAYRVLDAQHFGVPQRRRRVFVVACLGAGGWESAAKVLFEPESLSGDTAKGRKKGQEVTGTLSSRTSAGGGLGTDFDCAGGLQAVPFRKSKRACSTTDDESWVEAGEANTLNNFDLGDTRTTHAVVNSVAPTVTSSGPPYSRTGNERVEAEALAITFQPGNLRREAGADPQGVELYNQTLTGDIHVPIRTAGGHGAPAVLGPIAFNSKQSSTSQSPSFDDKAPTLDVAKAGGACVAFQPGNLRRAAGADPSTTTTTTLKASAGDQTPHVATPMAVRRLTPTECMRLQGFPDDWARIPWKGKPADQCPDGPQYKAAGNSMAVPVMRWIGSRIAAVDASR